MNDLLPDGHTGRRVQGMVMNEEVQQDLEKCLVLIVDGKIDKSLVFIYDVV